MLYSLAFFLTIASCIPVKKSKVLLPSEDDFYRPVEGYEKKPLGMLLNWRHSPSNPHLLFDTIDIEASYQILYRSSDSLGRPRANVATVLVPYNADTSKLLSYQAAEDSACVDCAVSFQLQDPEIFANAPPKFEILGIEAALDLGWVVIVPDYEGPQAAFTAGRQAAHSVLDGIRAVMSSESVIDIDEDASVAMWGYSGGSFATGWAAELAPRYAPELDICGIAVGGFAINLTSVAEQTNNGPFVGMIIGGINGLRQEYEDFDMVVDKYLEPSMKQDFNGARQRCLFGDMYENLFVNWHDYFTIGKRILKNPTIAGILDANTLGQHVPQVPMMIYHSIDDEITPFDDVECWYNSHCKLGADIELRADMTGEHITQMALGIPGAIAWLKQRLEGDEYEKGCIRNEGMSNFLDPDGLAMVGSLLMSVLKGMLGAELGPQD